MTTPTPRVHLSEAEAAELCAELDRARADLARAQELIAELRDVAERAYRAFARYDTGGGETPPDLGSAPRAQGAAKGVVSSDTPLVARAYRDDWADGYLARHHETEETR